MRSIAKSTTYISGFDERTTGGPEHPPIRLDQPDRKAAAPANESGAFAWRPDVSIWSANALAAGRPTLIHRAFDKQERSGVPGLDGMLGGGGFYHGSGKSSPMAISNLGRRCRDHVPGKYQIEVVDLKKNPPLVREHLTVTTPTLVREPTVPTRKIIGALSDEHKVLISLRNE